MDDKQGTIVIEGVVEANDYHDGPEVFSRPVPEPLLFSALKPLHGQRVRVTIEVLG